MTIGLIDLSESIVETSTSPIIHDLLYWLMVLVLGVGWAILFAIVLPLACRALRSPLSPWPVLAYVTLAALAAQAVTIFLVDIVITRLNLRPWIDDNANGYVETGVLIALYVLPPLAAALAVLAGRAKATHPGRRPA